MNNKNKFIEKIEDDYNNGKISLSEISELREKYQGSNDEEKLAIAKNYETYNYKDITIRKSSGFKGFGYIVAIISSIIYTVATGQFSADLASLVGSLIGALLVPIVITAVVYGFSQKDFEIKLAIITPIIQTLAYLGQTWNN